MVEGGDAVIACEGCRDGRVWGGWEGSENSRADHRGDPSDPPELSSQGEAGK